MWNRILFKLPINVDLETQGKIVIYSKKGKSMKVDIAGENKTQVQTIKTGGEVKHKTTEASNCQHRRGSEITYAGKNRLKNKVKEKLTQGGETEDTAVNK